MNFIVGTRCNVTVPKKLMSMAVRMIVVLYCVVLGVVANPAPKSDAYTSYQTALKKGDWDKAAAWAAKAYAAAPYDPLLCLTYATSLRHADSAAMLLQHLAHSDTIADSIREQARLRLADMKYAKSSYDAAMDWYRQASILRDTGSTQHRLALSALNAGSYVVAESLWLLFVGKNDGTYSRRATLYLGKIFLKEANFESALTWFSNAAVVSGSVSWRPAALYGQLFAAVRNGEDDSVKSYYNRYKLKGLQGLESRLAQTIYQEYSTKSSIPVVSEKVQPKQSEPVLAIASADPKALPQFTLQVGSFALNENATKLRTALAKEFSDVAIVEATVGDKTLYRVFAGLYGSREQAQKFASEHLVKKNISYRICVK